jgi:hypothetical protein
MAALDITAAYLMRKERQLGTALPCLTNTDAVGGMVAGDSPLCCYLGDEALTAILDRCELL